MTSTNMNWSTEQPVAHVPFLLSPVGKDYLWGGTRLNDDFSKNLPCDPLAETWECSTHPDGPSTVRSGAFAGRTLQTVLAEHPEFIGTHPRMEAGGGLPVLVKLIDAKRDLSVQVHPTDAYAREFENGQMGKTEMWYVVEAAKDAHLIYGFLRDMDEAAVRRALADGTLLRHLQKVPVRKGDTFFIPAGTVHAICAGCLVAEVQESSNLTYRFYDYDRVDKTGKKRELHIEKALAVANLRGSAAPVQPMHLIRFRPGLMIESLCSCRYFLAEKVTVDTQRCRDLAWFHTRKNSFRVLLCLEGCGTLRWSETPGGPPEYLDFFRGDCIFVPADSVPYCILGTAVLLRVSC